MIHFNFRLNWYLDCLLVKLYSTSRPRPRPRPRPRLNSTELAPDAEELPHNRVELDGCFNHCHWRLFQLVLKFED
jgi:hypothetical protein